jgi:LacI family fructose operon transcriptional repressor
MSKTVDEIARETGSSVTTVRFVINGQAEKYRISAKTQKKIEEFIAIHGYSLNHAARSLKLNRSDTIGLVVPDLANAFFSRFMAALEALCRTRNLLLLTVSSHEDPALEDRAVASLLARGVDGLVMAPCQADVLPQLLKIRARKSIVMFDRDYSSAYFSTVASDNFQGGLEMTRKMLQETRDSCYFLCGHVDLPSIQDRIRGFTLACEERGITGSNHLILSEGQNSTAAGWQLMQGLIDSLKRPPRAFMCSSLLVLEGALQQINARFGRIDKKIVIGTFDDHTMLDLLPNRVVSMKQDEAALAQRVFERLIEPANERKGDSLRDIVPCRLICRNL